MLNAFEWPGQCCPKMVAWSPNATNKRNGWPIITRRVVRFMTNVLKYSNHVLSNMTGVAWQHRCWATCQISKQLEYLKYKYHAFLLLVENKKHNVTLRNCCFIVIIDHISTYGPPNRYTDHPTIPRGCSIGARATHDFRLWTAMPGLLLLPRADTSKSIASRKPLSQMRWEPCNYPPTPASLAIQTHHTKIGHTTTSQHWYGTGPGPEHISLQWVSVRKM